MAGETNLDKLLGSMDAVLQEPVYVFVTTQAGEKHALASEPIMTFREPEGLTMIVEEQAALDAGLTPVFRSRMITLNVHSSLEAVGFLAVITAKLAAAGMGVNPVSAFYHDHLFVPADRADEAMGLLQALAREHIF